MKQIEINLNVLIHKVKLHVRFPCSLIANLKIQNAETAMGPQVPLRVGEAYLQLSASQKMSLFYDSNKSTFSEKKIAVCIYLNTSSGRIPAGAAYILMNSLKRGLNKQSLSIDKCPDKSAYIDASISYEILSQTEATGAENIPELVIGRDPFTLREPMNNRQARSIQKSNFRANERTGLNSPKESSATEMKLSIKSLERSKVQGYRSNIAVKAETEDRAESTHKTGDVSDRQEYINQSPGRMIDYSAKLRMGELEKELKNFQKKYEQSALQLKSAIAKKDLLERSLKESEGQARIFKQKYEDLQQSNENALKRNDYKQNSYKEQIKTLTEKLSSSENEKQLMIFEKNDLVNDFQEREKTLRLSIKEKQKQFNEEKNKLIKKNENLAKELLQLQAKLAENDKKLLESVKQGNDESKKNELLQDKCQQLLAQINDLKETLVLQRSKRAEIEENLGSNLELQQEKKKLKKKIAEQQQEMARLNKNIAQIDSNYQKMVKKSQELEATLKEKINLLKNLQKDYDGSVKQSETLKKTLEDKQRKLEETLSLKQGQSSKLEALTDQLRQSQKKNQEESKNLKKEIQQKERKIQVLMKENEDNVESINDYNTKLEKQQVDIQALKDKINALKIENGELLHQKQKLQLELGQIKDHFSQEKLNKEELESALRKELREKEVELKNLEESLKKYQNSSLHRQQQDAFKIANLQQKIANLENDVYDHLSEIHGLQDKIKQLQYEKYHGESLSDELQYNLKLKGNEIAFLKQNAEKNNQQISDLTKQNKEMSIKIQKLEDKVFEFENLTETLNHQLNEATENGSGIQQKLANYIKLNNQKISSFLNVFLSGSKVTIKPIHQQAELQVLMQSVITKVNQVYTKYQEQIKHLQAQLDATIAQRDELNQKLIASLKQNQALHSDLQDTLNKNRQTNKNADSIISDLKTQLSDANHQIAAKDIQISELNAANLSLTQQLDSLHNGFGNKQEQNSVLKSRISDLQETLKKKEKEYLSNESRLNKKYEDDSNNFKSKISELQENAKKQAAKLADCTNKLNEKIKEYKELERKTNEEIKKLKTEIERLTAQVAKQTKQLQSKSNLNSKYGQIEAQLRAKLEQAGKDNAALRELNENIRKRNQKAAQRQKEQDALIFSLKGGQTQLASKQSDLQKAIKERTAEYVASREQNFKLQKEKQKLIQDLQIANSMIKVKEDYQKKIQTSLKNIEQQKVGLKDTIKSLELAANEISRKSQKEISVLNETKNKYDKQLEETKQKLQAAQAQLAKESTTNQQANKQLADELKELKVRNKQLEDERSLALKNLQEQERAHSAEDAYLKPIRDHLQSLKGHMAEYSRASDQFQSNKNKLLKLATTKSELPNEKYISDRIRDFSNAYNKLKTFILGCKLSEQAKLQAGEEIKKVQSALDKVLRGDK